MVSTEAIAFDALRHPQTSPENVMTMNKASTLPFEGKGAVEIVAEMRRMQKTKGVTPSKQAESLDVHIQRLSEKFTGKNDAVGQAERTRRLQEAEENAKRSKAAAMWNEAGVPERHSERKSFEDCKAWSKALERIRTTIAKNGHVALIGNFGTGKTQLAVEMIREETSRGQSALFTTATRFLRTIKGCYRDEAKTTEASVLSMHTKPRLLVIDEFHRRKGSDWENEQLFDLINERYNAMKPMIIICNQTSQEFGSAMDGAILDRLNETGGIIECNWKSFRA